MRLEKILKERGLFLIGEYHGTKEIPQFLRTICSMLIKLNFDINLCLELPKQIQADVLRILENKKLNKKNIKIFKDLIKDGRLTPFLIKSLRIIKSYAIKNNKKFNVFCVDSAFGKIEERDLNMLNLILQLYNKKDKKTKIIFYGGNFHMSTKEIIVGNNKFVPLGKLLKKSKLYKNSFTFFILPLKGKIYNNGIRRISNRPIQNIEKLRFTKIIRKVSPSYFTFEMLNKKLFL